jgi:hypothetical protein
VKRIIVGLLTVTVGLFEAEAIAKPQKASSGDTKPPAIRHTKVERAPLGQAIVIRAEIIDESDIFAPSVQFRPKGSKEYDSIEMRDNGAEYEAKIPAEQVNTDIEYYIEAFDSAGNGPARAGSPEEPIRVKVFDPSKPESKSRATKPRPKDEEPDLTAEAPPAADDGSGGLLSKWWFWTIAAAVVAGGAVGIYFATKGPVTAVDVAVRGPDPAGGL